MALRDKKGAFSADVKFPDWRLMKANAFLTKNAFRFWNLCHRRLLMLRI